MDRHGPPRPRPAAQRAQIGTMPARAKSGRIAYAIFLIAALVVQLLTGLHAAWGGQSMPLAIIGGLSAIGGLAFALLLLREMRIRDEAQAALSASEARFRDFAASSSDWLWETDSEHRLIWFNEKIREAWFAKEDALGRKCWEMGPQDDDPAKWAAHRADLEARRAFRNFEYAQPDQTGRLRHVRISGRPAFGADGAFLGYRGTALDITAEVEARAEAERAVALLTDGIGSIAESFALFDVNDRLIICNQRYADHNGGKADALKGRTFAEIVTLAARDRLDPESLGSDREAWVRWRVEQHRNPGRAIEVKYRDGHWNRIIENRTRDGGIVLVSADITESKNREEELQSRVAQQNSVALLAQLAFEPVDLERLLAKATDLVTRTLGAPLSSVFELTGDGREFLLRASTGWSRDQIGNFRLPFEGRRLAAYTIKSRLPVVSPDLSAEDRFDVNPAIRERGYRSVAAVTIGGAHQPFGILTCASDRLDAFSAGGVNFIQAVANVLASAIQLRQQGARLRAILDNSVDAILSLDDQGHIQSANQAVERIYGYSEADLLDREVTLLLSERHRASFKDKLRGNGTPDGSNFIGELREIEGLRRDGVEFPIDIGLRELRLGSRRVFIATIRDATARKATEQHLRQAQKMEAIGQLTGGIAHDFNNMLTIILGNAEMLLESLPSSAQSEHAQAGMIVAAANSGAQLTQRLLAFARQQTLAAVPFDANALVLKTADLLQRALGEHVVVRTDLAGDLPLVFADPSQLENALVNLAVNGRDAMPDGGVLAIRTARAHLDDAPAALGAGTGDYVMLAVTDTGTGMTAAVLGRAFEPFFTTKEVGKGTGLGLSMVYGFVTQSRGHVRIESDIGRGTTVRLYLPPAPAGVEAAALPAGSSQVPHGSGAILMVEDNADVRHLTTTQLRSLGYTVIEAQDATSALAIIDSDRPLDLLFTDVVMPGGIDGRELAARARARRPDLRILLASGYSELTRFAASNDPFEILSKPYGKRELAQRVHAALSRSPSAM
jgi:PAS domain S-box-containing protein